MTHAPGGGWPLGTLVLIPRRHVVHTADLCHEESRTLGPLLRDLAAAATVLTDPVQVYVGQWSHHGGVACHLHYMVEPIGSMLMEQYPGRVGPALQALVIQSGVAPSNADTIRIADCTRELLKSPVRCRPSRQSPSGLIAAPSQTVRK